MITIVASRQTPFAEDPEDIMITHAPTSVRSPDNDPDPDVCCMARRMRYGKRSLTATEHAGPGDALLKTWLGRTVGTIPMR